MKQFRQVARRLAREAVRFGLRLSLVGAALALATVVALAPSHTSQPAPAWGEEALAGGTEPGSSWSLISLANACGLGASSCFKCHNGTRAALPKSGPDTGLWHAQHASVNYSCAGCHQGNPRIIRQDIAHRGLLANPAAEPEKACASCHGAEEGKLLAERYQGSHPHLLRGNQ